MKIILFSVTLFKRLHLLYSIMLMPDYRINIRLLFSFIVSLLFLCTAAHSQQGEAPAKRFGISAGINAANMNFNKGYPTPATPIKASWKGGFTIGGIIDVPLVKRFYLQPGYYFMQRNGADNSAKTNYKLQYFCLPLLLNYKASPVFSLLAGPQAELLIKARVDSNGQSKNITHDVEERSIGAAAGFDVSISSGFFVSARYFHGLNNIGIGQRSQVKEFKYEVFTLSAGIRF